MGNKYFRTRLGFAIMTTIAIAIAMAICLYVNFLTVNANAQTYLTELTLPTKNNYLFSSSPEKFYMYTDRNFEGRKSRPWTGGKFGFSRNQKRTKYGIVHSGFHEGIDIKPLRRDSKGNPLDAVVSVANGTVVYTNSSASRSNYGKYIVVQHNWGEGDFYTLYAHLNSIYVNTGNRVLTGQKIGKLGFTGAGINRRRSHLHFEINLMINKRFSVWHGKHFTSQNYHGIYNGINLMGVDSVAVFRTFRSTRRFSMRELIARMRPYFKVIMPAKKSSRGTQVLPILSYYPWLLKAKSSVVNSWEVTFSSSGVPLAVRGSASNVSSPRVTWARLSSTPHAYNTRYRLSGLGKSVRLSKSGRRFIQLVSDSF